MEAWKLLTQDRPTQAAGARRMEAAAEVHPTPEAMEASLRMRAGRW